MQLTGTLGGATLGSIALAGSPTSHLTAGLLMTGDHLLLLLFLVESKACKFLN